MPYRLTLCEMAEQIRARKLSPVELVEAHLARIERLNPRLNAFISVFGDQARSAAKASEAAVMRGEARGRLEGIPLSIKDSFDVAGEPTLCGSRFRLGHRAAHDATSVARLRAAGAIVLGKTNCPEFLSYYETDNLLFGRTNNPWDPSRTPGGSSGGESAAIAARCSAGGMGSDGGGSIREPAHFCGIAGLKPTPGRVPASGHFPLIAHPGGLLGVGGPMARTARDLRVLFEATAGYDSQDPFSAPVPLREPTTGGLRIGAMESFGDAPVEESCREAVKRAARLLAELGFTVEPFAPRGLDRAFDLWWFFFGRVPAPFTGQLIQGREHEAHWTSTDFMERALAQPPVSASEIVENLSARDHMRAALLRQMESCPLIVLPVCGVTAFPHRQRTWLAEGKNLDLFGMIQPLVWVNLLGLPAVVVPSHVTDQGLPVGVQIVGRPYDEELLLEIAVRLESARGPFPAPRDHL